ncbi:hypothetical protein PRIPAC_95503, partial [Pristionchus pacificus]|uniref:glucuronosyltransferase n=1 Tax=Pristionchus pacificus TaxID=54126 RepID=A0A2A6B347_PRIPA
NWLGVADPAIWRKMSNAFRIPYFTLEDARLSAFITHGGAGSTTEATHSGVPLIVVPLMGDQLRNSHLIERLGTGIKISKDSLNSAAELTAAVKRIIEDKSFKEKAALVAAQLREAPFSPREKLVRNMEFMAKYGPLTMLDHYGPQLFTFQYYLIDVFAFLFLVLVVILGLYTMRHRQTVTLRWNTNDKVEKVEHGLIVSISVNSFLQIFILVVGILCAYYQVTVVSVFLPLLVSLYTCSSFWTMLMFVPSVRASIFSSATRERLLRLLQSSSGVTSNG